MKTNVAVIAALLIAVLAPARDVRSPDQRYAIRAGQAISLVDVHSGETLLVLDKDTSGTTRVEVAWSPDSRKVALVEDDARGSVVLGAWTDAPAATPFNGALDQWMSSSRPQVLWHKTVQDENEKGIFAEAQRRFCGRVVKENRVFAGWITADSLRVKGEIHLSSGKHCAYQYVLQFNTNVTGHLSRAGFEEGMLVGRDHQLL
jgi:hypothetical protein